MSCVFSSPTLLKCAPASVDRNTPRPHDELLRPLPSPVPTQTILPLPRLARSSASDFAALFAPFSPLAFLSPFAVAAGAASVLRSASSFAQPRQLDGASATAMAPTDATPVASNTDEKVT